jgi:hypothetical protein
MAVSAALGKILPGIEQARHRCKVSVVAAHGGRPQINHASD